MIRIRGLDKGEKPALLISECQRAMTDTAFTDRELARIVDERRMIPAIANLAQAFRDLDLPVIHVTLVPAAANDYPVSCVLMANVRKRGVLRAGSPGADIHPDLAPREGDVVAQREHGISGFAHTELERLLRVRSVQTVVLAGVSTNIALPTMAAEAVNRLFNVVFAEDCTSGATHATHRFQVEYHLPQLGAVAVSEDIIAAVRTSRMVLKRHSQAS